VSSLADLVIESLAATELNDRDAAAAELALTYARQIDGHKPCEECGCQGGGDLTKLGPALLAVLDALGLTPRARKAVKTDGQQPSANALDQLAERRAGRGRPQAVDTGAP
jgi:hypothetical protein